MMGFMVIEGKQKGRILMHPYIKKAGLTKNSTNSARTIPSTKSTPKYSRRSNDLGKSYSKVCMPKTPGSIESHTA